jgi:hypothetical protein
MTTGLSEMEFEVEYVVKKLKSNGRLLLNTVINVKTNS